jgi:N,N'-diacetyllegionaminate synthase
MEIWAEAGTCEGSVEYALLAAQAVHDAGADALKVQWHDPARIFSLNVPRYDKTDSRSITQNELAAAHIPYEDWRPVVDKCNTLGIRFIPSIFDPESIPFLEKFALSHAKIASGDITNRWLIQEVADALRFHQPWQPTLCISTGASTADEIKRAIKWVADAKFRGTLQLLACHLAYPTDDTEAHLGRVVALAALVTEMNTNRQVGNIARIEVGYSDHTTSLDTPTLLAAMGVSVLEKHFTLLGRGHGSDHEFAVDPPQLFNLVQAKDRAVTMMGNYILSPTVNELPAREGARRSLAASRDIAKGSRLTVDMFTMLRPGTGIPPYDLERVIGAGSFKQQTAVVDIPQGTIITWKMIGLASATLTVE